MESEPFLRKRPIINISTLKDAFKPSTIDPQPVTTNMKTLPAQPQPATSNMKSSSHTHNHNQTNPKPQSKPKTKPETQPPSRLVHTGNPQPQLKKNRNLVIKFSLSINNNLHGKNAPTTTPKQNPKNKQNKTQNTTAQKICTHMGS